jgi:polysaccharide deacetylase 2 family uncharacterized protein YibQ
MNKSGAHTGQSREILILLIMGLCIFASIYAVNVTFRKDSESDESVVDERPESDEAPLSRDELPEKVTDIAPKSPDKVKRLIKSGDAAGYLAIVLDDCGGNIVLARQVNSLDLPITWAIIPRLKYSSETAQLLRESEVPFLIHVPMQAVSDPDGKAGDPRFYYIGAGMSENEVREALTPILDSLPDAYGINNHRGSKATADRDLMKSVMTVLSERGLFFMDSNTSRETVAYEIAVETGLRAAKNARFLDNKSELAAISLQMEQAVSSALKKGSHIAICHLRPGTVTFLEGLSRDDIAKRGVMLVTLPQLMELGESTDE